MILTLYTSRVCRFRIAIRIHSHICILYNIFKLNIASYHLQTAVNTTSKKIIQKNQSRFDNRPFLCRTPYKYILLVPQHCNSFKSGDKVDGHTLRYRISLKNPTQREIPGIFTLLSATFEVSLNTAYYFRMSNVKARNPKQLPHRKVTTFILVHRNYVIFSDVYPTMTIPYHRKGNSRMYIEEMVAYKHRPRYLAPCSFVS